MTDVELPDGRHLDRRLIRTPPGAGAVVLADGKVLLMWRHRFITGTEGWEIPIGRIDRDEDPGTAARRSPAFNPMLVQRFLGDSTPVPDDYLVAGRGGTHAHLAPGRPRPEDGGL